MPCNFQNPYHTTSTFYKRLLMYTPCVKQLIRALRMFARRISSYSLVLQVVKLEQYFMLIVFEWEYYVYNDIAECMLTGSHCLNIRTYYLQDI